MLKRLTGQEKIFNRALFKKADTDFRPQFKLAYICNHLPRVRQDDYGAWRRILLYLFKSWFPPNDLDVPATWKEQVAKRTFLRDTSFMSKIPTMRQAQMWIMVQCYKRVMKRKVQPPLPKEVTGALELYRIQNDPYLQFINEMMKRDDKATIGLIDFYNAYKSWYTESIGGKVPNRNQVKIDMVAKWGNTNAANKWIGWRMRKMEDDIAEGKTE